MFTVVFVYEATGLGPDGDTHRFSGDWEYDCDDDMRPTDGHIRSRIDVEASIVADRMGIDPDTVEVTHIAGIGMNRR